MRSKKFSDQLLMLIFNEQKQEISLVNLGNSHNLCRAFKSLKIGEHEFFDPANFFVTLTPNFRKVESKNSGCNNTYSRSIRKLKIIFSEVNMFCECSGEVLCFLRPTVYVYQKHVSSLVRHWGMNR